MLRQPLFYGSKRTQNPAAFLALLAQRELQKSEPTGEQIVRVRAALLSGDGPAVGTCPNPPRNRVASREGERSLDVADLEGHVIPGLELICLVVDRAQLGRGFDLRSRAFTNDQLAGVLLNARFDRNANDGAA